MSMHFGILVADMPWAEFFPLLSSKTGRFIDQGPVDNLDELDDLEPPEKGQHRFVAGEYRGKSYVLDMSTMLTIPGGDLVAELSKETGALVIGCGALTTFESYAFLAVRAGVVLRHYFDNQALLSQPYDEGEELPTEEEMPFEDPEGLFAALAHFGFDYDGWYKEGEHRQYLHIGDETRGSEEEQGALAKGPLMDKLAEHYAQFALPPEERPTIMMFTRDAKTGQIVSTQDTGLRYGDEELSDPEFWNRFWNRLTN